MNRILIIFVMGIVGFDHPMKQVCLEPFPMTFSRHHLKLSEMQKEVWKDIKGYKGLYQVSNHGRVKSFHNSSIQHLKPRDVKGYLCVVLYKDTFPKKHYIHRLVLLHFIGTDKGGQCNHINGIKTDNHIGNLEWCTPSENIRHSYKLGLHKAKRGESNGMSKVNEKQVKEIRILYPSLSQQKIADKYGLGQRTVFEIIHKLTWKHV